MTHSNHIAKHTHANGKELVVALAWCGAPIAGWHYLNAQHAALSIEADDHPSWNVCIRCVEQIRDTMSWAYTQRASS